MENVKTSKEMTTKVEVMEASKGAKKSRYNRSFETSLMNKEEVFKMLALAEALRLPVLLIGIPGTAKTGTVLDYTKGRFDLNDKDEKDHFDQEGVFMLETDEGTKSSDIKGVVDIEKLVVHNKYALLSPVTQADSVIINEVDKASSSLRNALLGIMNERILFNGKDKIPCVWKSFVATCNEIPKDEVNSPFWDRFVLKVTVNRLKSGELVQYYKNGGKNYRKTIRLTVPTQQEIESVSIDPNKLEKFINMAYKSCSDRTLSYVPTMTQAVSLVYNCSVDKALIKVCEILVDTKTATALSKELLSPEKRSIMDKIDLIQGYTNGTQVESAIEEIERNVAQYIKTGKFVEADIKEIKSMIETSMENHQYYKVEISVDEDDQYNGGDEDEEDED